MNPYFSIIIPMYNRERFITRAINSCLNQDFQDFEIIIIDDGSTDRSAQVVAEIGDPRIVLIRNEHNQERLISRNIGAKASKGEWLIWFDSDDELVPDALTIITQRINELPDDVFGLRFMCLLDSGQISPDPPHQNEIWDYEGFIRWIESHNGGWSESLPIVNKHTIQYVLFPEDNIFTSEMQYHLDFLAKYKVMACEDVLRLYHQDADNNTWKPNIEGMLKTAPIFAARIESVIAMHGSSIKKWAPKTYEVQYLGMITQLFLSNQKYKACKKFLRGLKLGIYEFRGWIIMFFGIISPYLLAYAKNIQSARKLKTGQLNK